MEISFLIIFLKILFVVCSPLDKGKCPSIAFSEYDEIIFHLAAMSQSEQGGKGHIWDSAHVVRSNLQLVRIRVNVYYGLQLVHSVREHKLFLHPMSVLQWCTRKYCKSTFDQCVILLSAIHRSSPWRIVKV